MVRLRAFAFIKAFNVILDFVEMIDSIHLRALGARSSDPRYIGHGSAIVIHVLIAISHQ